MSANPALDIVTAPNRDSKHWKASTISWRDLVAWTDSPADHKECGNYVLGTLRGSVRSKSTIQTRSALTLDADNAVASLPALVELTLGCLGLVHTTFQSSPKQPRYRVILPLSRSVAPDEYHALATVVMDHLGAKQFDPGSVQPERYMFMPSAHTPEHFARYVLEGEPLDPDEWLSEYDGDLSGREAPTVHKNKRDPFTLEGVVGAFNRAYSIAEAIKQFDLPYTPVGENHWTLAGSRSTAGLNLIAEGLVFSHHVTDPAWNRTCSAFDLVRVHLFGELDADSSDQTPVTRLPSHIAMAEMASTDALVIRELVGSDFAAEMADIAADIDHDAAAHWEDQLRWDRAGRMRDTMENWDKVTANEPVFQLFMYNELTGTVEVSGDLPWRPLTQGGAILSSADRAALCHHLERKFKVRPARSFVDEMIAIKAQNRFVNPLRDWLVSLVWDGVERLETCLPGVRPTAYTRMVARKSLVAAVSRVMEPGIKWDHTLIFQGMEGVGKSYWVDKMAKGYSAGLGRIGDKDTLLTMQRSWIMFADEGFSLKKADADAQKEFLTKTEDVYRMPYDREPQVHKRHCVIWGTTNDEVFLRRQEGNRRFLIVNCEDKVDFSTLTPDYVDQVWAEAMHLYRAGEVLFLSDDEATTAKEQREHFTEEDSMAGVLEAWLNTLVPLEWETMTPAARMDWVSATRNGYGEPGEFPIRRTCTRQLWFEALGQTLEPRMLDLLQIGKSLKLVPGWAPSPGRHRFGVYGPQNLYVRQPQNTDTDGAEAPTL